MDELLKQKLKDLAKKDKARFLNVVAYVILKEAIENDPEAKKLVQIVEGLSNVNIQDLLDNLIDKAMEQRPDLMNILLGAGFLAGYIMSKAKK